MKTEAGRRKVTWPRSRTKVCGLAELVGLGSCLLEAMYIPDHSIASLLSSWALSRVWRLEFSVSTVTTIICSSLSLSCHSCCSGTDCKVGHPLLPTKRKTSDRSCSSHLILLHLLFFVFQTTSMTGTYEGRRCWLILLLEDLNMISVLSPPLQQTANRNCLEQGRNV